MPPSTETSTPPTTPPPVSAAEPVIVTEVPNWSTSPAVGETTTEIGLTVSERALDLLGEAGFDPVYGARPLKRAIQNQLENPLANEILSGRFGAGDEIRVDVEDGHLVFAK